MGIVGGVVNLTQSLAYLNSTPHPVTSRNPENDPDPYPCDCGEDVWPGQACAHCGADVDLIGWDETDAEAQWSADEDEFMDTRSLR